MEETIKMRDIEEQQETSTIYGVMEGLWEETYPHHRLFTTKAKAREYIMQLARDEIKEYNERSKHRRAYINESTNDIEVRVLKVDNFDDGLRKDIPHNRYRIFESRLD